MKLCIPVRVPDGLGSCVEPHLPHAEHLLFFDTDTRDIRHVVLREHLDSAAGAPHFDAVLCGSFDKATRRALTEKGILAYGTQARTAGEAIAEFEAEVFPAGRSKARQHGDGHLGQDGDQKKSLLKCNGGCGKHGGKHAIGGHGRHQDTVPLKIRGDTLKIAVSSQNGKTITDHAGRCRKFWVYEIRGNKIDDRTLRELTPEQTLYSSSLGNDHPLHDVHVMITAGMSPFLYQRLQDGDIRPFVTEESDPDEAVRILLEKVAQVVQAQV